MKPTRFRGGRTGMPVSTDKILGADRPGRHGLGLQARQKLLAQLR
jgi:hypothetical protein